MDALAQLAASNGSFLIADTNARTGRNNYAFYVREDTVVSVMTGVILSDTGAPPNVDFKSTLGITGKTLKAGDLFIVPSGQRINAITLTSGSIIVY